MPTTPSHPISTNAELLQDLARDPAIAAILQAARRKAFSILDKHTNELVGTLAKNADVPSTSQKNLPTDVRSLGISSRRSTTDLKTRRTYAHDMLVAGIFNMDNAEWDFTDASSYQTESDNLIVQLMQLQLPDAG